MINIQPWPGVKSLYQPDAIECLKIKGKEYLVTANEGIFPSGSYYYRINDEDVVLDPTAFRKLFRNFRMNRRHYKLRIKLYPV